MYKKLTVTFAIVTSLMCSSVFGQTTKPTPATEGDSGFKTPDWVQNQIAPFLDQQFLLAASLNNNAEIALSALAVDKAQDESVSSFAEQMIQAHAAVGTQIIETAGFIAANQSGVINPAGTNALQGLLDPATAVALAGLAQTSKEDFDHAYMRKMILNHQSAVDLFKTEDQYGEEESVVSFARETLDTLREHLTEARSIYDALNNSSSNSSTSDSSSSSSSGGSSSSASSNKG